MKPPVRALALAVVTYAALESAWLYGSRSFYAARFASVSADGRLRIRSTLAVALVYPLLLLGAWILVLRPFWASKGRDVGTCACAGALFGATVYGVYNLTNMATLPGYSWSLVAVDTLWGSVAFAAVAAVFAAVAAVLAPVAPAQ